MAVIEVDLEAPGEHALPPLPVHRYRWAGLIAVAVLLFTLGGAAPPASVLWRELGAVPLGGSGWYSINGDRVVTLDEGVVTGWKLSADSVSPAWTVSLPPVRSANWTRVAIGSRLLVTGDAVLAQSSDYQATVLDPATGRVRWRSPKRIEFEVGGVGLTRQTTFRPRTDYDRSSGDPGVIYMSEDGTPHTEPPQYTDLNGVDLATGRALWTVPAAGSVFVTPAGDAVLMVASDRIALIDARTGAIRRELKVPGLSWGQISGGLALVRSDAAPPPAAKPPAKPPAKPSARAENPGPSGAGLLAYDAGTLEPRWRVPAGQVGDDSMSGSCRDLVCRPVSGGLEVLDEATGAVRWRTGPDVSLRRSGGEVLEYSTATQRPVRLLDPATGAMLADLRSWQATAQTDGDQLVLSRREQGAVTRVFAVARHGIVSPLGRGDMAAQDCTTNARIVACRASDAVILYAYR